MDMSRNDNIANLAETKARLSSALIPQGGWGLHWTSRSPDGRILNPDASPDSSNDSHRRKDGRKRRSVVIQSSTPPPDRSQDAVGGSPVLGHPPATIDPDWRERIEIAKRVRDETRKARGDKPSTFDMRGPPIRIRR